MVGIAAAIDSFSQQAHEFADQHGVEDIFQAMDWARDNAPGMLRDAVKGQVIDREMQSWGMLFGHYKNATGGAG